MSWAWYQASIIQHQVDGNLDRFFFERKGGGVVCCLGVLFLQQFASYIMDCYYFFASIEGVYITRSKGK